MLKRLLCVTRRDRIRNDIIRNMLQQEESLVQKATGMWFGHVTRMERERLPLRALHCHREGKRSQGRQPKTWMSCIKEDVAEQDKSHTASSETCKKQSCVA